MRIESIAYEEEYLDLNCPSNANVIDSFLIKSSGEIFRKCNGKSYTYNKATKKDFEEFEEELVSFIETADHTVYFFDNMKVSIIIIYSNGTKQIVERGLACEDEFFDSIIEDYLDEFTEC